MKKTLSFLLALVLAISSLGLIAGADWIQSEDITIDDFGISIYRDGTVSITEYYGCASDLVIPEKVGEYTITKISSGAFDDCTFINNISIPDTIMEIEAYAFYNTGYYNNLDNWENSALYIGKHLVSAKEDVSVLIIKDGTEFIAEGLMEYNHNLTTIVFPSSIKFIGASAFTHCINIETIAINGNIQNIKKWTFSNCSNLNSVVLNEGLKQIDGSSFIDCDDLRSIYLPSSIEFIDEYAFDGCTEFTDVYYGGTQEEWNSKVVTYLEGQYDFEGKTVHFNHIHKDENGNGICDECVESNESNRPDIPSTEPDEPTTNPDSDTPSADCSCNCHKSGFMSFIWKILRIFYKLFGVNRTCSCGVAHY